MADKYFAKFPEIYYKKTRCKDISRLVSLEGEGRNSPFRFQPFTLRDELRPDHVSEFYYEDAEMDWMVFLSNKIIDPYYQWYLSQEHFAKFITEKYGSVDTAMQKILFFRNNWYDDEKTITPNDYDNTIPYAWKKYYTPVYGANLRVIHYKRKEEDWTMNTNRIVQYDVTYSAGNSFSVGELVNIKHSGTIIGVGETTFSNSSVVIIKNVQGNTTANSTYAVTLEGRSVNTIANSSLSDVIQENIPLTEDVFWSPVYYYDEEYGINEERKAITLVSAELSSLVSAEIEKKIQED